jgi:CDP-2,3-bis-(O-geranylgeranyl)-sn-glycerol synthase
MLHQTILEALWLLLPAGVANTVPVLAARYRWLPQLDRPLDGGLVFAGRRLLGQNKTWRGFLLGVLGASLTGLLQYFIVISAKIRDPFFAPYFSLFSALSFGAVIGLAALLGDAVKSFVKRRLGRLPGQSWAPFDQVDFIIGMLVVSVWYVALTPLHVFLALVIGGVGSYLTSFVGTKLKIKKSL